LPMCVCLPNNLTSCWQTFVKFLTGGMYDLKTGDKILMKVICMTAVLVNSGKVRGKWDVSDPEFDHEYVSLEAASKCIFLFFHESTGCLETHLALCYICVITCCLNHCKTITRANIAPIMSLNMHYLSPEERRNLVCFFALENVHKFNVIVSLSQGLGRCYRGRTLLAHGNNFCRTPFLPPPVTHMGTSGS